MTTEAVVRHVAKEPHPWLFVIGINTYIEWPRLKTAVNDARSVKDVLLSRYYFYKKNLIELYDEQATRCFSSKLWGCYILTRISATQYLHAQFSFYLNPFPWFLNRIQRKNILAMYFCDSTGLLFLKYVTKKN